MSELGRWDFNRDHKHSEADTSYLAAVEFGGADYADGRWADLKKCSDCDRPLRPYGARWKNWPATVAPAAFGKCGMCYRRAGSSATELKAVPEPAPNKTTREEIAARWTEEQHAAAWVICGRAESSSDAEQIMSLLGLLERSDLTFTTSIPRFNEDFGSTEDRSAPKS